MKPVLYWAAAVLMVLALLLTIFGAAAFVMARHWRFHQVWGVFFIVVGVISAVVGRTSPSALWRQRWRSAPPPVVGPSAMQITTVVGIAFIVGGIAYALIGEVWVLICALALMSLYTRLSYRKMSDE
jgi:cation transporter-like permease